MSLEIIKAETKTITKNLFKPRNSFSFALSDGDMSQDIAYSKGLAKYLELVDEIVLANDVNLTEEPFVSIDKASDGSAYLEYGFAPIVRFGNSPFILIRNSKNKVIAGFINMYKRTTSYCPKTINKLVEDLVIQSMKNEDPISYGEAKESVNENIHTRNNPDNIPKITKQKDMLYFVDFENNILWANDSKNAGRDVRRMAAMLRNFVNYFTDAGFDNIDALKEMREQLFEGENIHLTDYPSYSTGMLKTVGSFNLHHTIEFFANNSENKDIQLTNTAKLKSRTDTGSSVAFKDSIELFMEKDKEDDSTDKSFFNRLYKFAENKSMEVKELKVQGELILPQSARDYMSDYANTAFTESGLGSLIDVEFKLGDTDGKMRVELCKTLQVKLLLELITRALASNFEDEVLSPAKSEAVILKIMGLVGELFLEKSKLFISTFHKTNAVSTTFGDLSARFEAGSASV